MIRAPFIPAVQLGLVLLGLLAGAARTAAAPPPPGSVPPWHWDLPAGVAPPPVPADNPMSAAKVELGRRLFYDADLSLNGTLSCATCHEQRRGFTDGNATHPGVDGNPGRRSPMPLANVAYLSPLTVANPAMTDLETQATVPLFGDHPVEMGMAGRTADLERRLAGQACYQRLFAAAFPPAGTVSLDTILKALAAFERTLLSFDAPYDRAARGEAGAAPTAAASHGRDLFFGEAGCAACHNGPAFSDGGFHRLAVSDPADGGLAESGGGAADRGRFRTATLRNTALGAPYLHNGGAPTLAAAIQAHYQEDAPDQGDVPAATRDPLLRGPGPDAAATADLVAFLDSLTDSRFIHDPRLSLPPPCAAGDVSLPAMPRPATVHPVKDGERVAPGPATR